MGYLRRGLAGRGIFAGWLIGMLGGTILAVLHGFAPMVGVQFGNLVVPLYIAIVALARKPRYGGRRYAARARVTSRSSFAAALKQHIDMMQPRLVIVAGLSGAGKSQVMKSLEDLGYSCIDNLPPVLMERTIEIAGETKLERLAIAPDVRSRGPHGDAVEAIDGLRKSGRSLELLFFRRHR